MIAQCRRQTIVSALLSVAFVLLLLPRQSVSQTVIRGRIVDASTGDPLPAANIQIEGTYRGTITNTEGRYDLRLERVPATILIRYIGYEGQRREITAASSPRQDFALIPVVYEAEAVVVTGEDPGIRIMREVIERKKVWRAALETYEATAYNRFSVSNDTGIVSIMETVTQAFWDKDEGTREVLKARRETSNMEFTEDLPAAMFVTNLYDDDIDVAGHNLMGVTHPDALSHYHFRLENTRRLGSRKVFDISVEPKRRTKSAFVGRVSVLDSAYALIDVELAPGESFIFPPPLDNFNVKFQQQFSSFGGDFWLPVDFRSELGLDITFGLLLSLPTISISQVSRLTDYQVNVAVPDSLFEDDDLLVVDSVSVSTDSLLETAGVAVPLSNAEEEAYAGIDSTLIMFKAFRPKGLLARFIDEDEAEEEEMEDRRRRRAERAGRPVEPEGGDRLLTDHAFLPNVWYNRVDQLHLGGDAWIDLGRRVRLSGGAGYNIAPDSVDRWSYSARARFRLGPSNRAYLAGGYQVGSVTRYDSEPYGRILNSGVLLLGGDDYYDYYWREGFDVEAGYGFRWADATVGVGYRQEDHESLSSSINEPPVGDRILRQNPAIEEGRLKAVSGSVSIGEREYNPGFVGRNRILVEVEHGFGDFSYMRYTAAGDLRIPTFFTRRLIPNTLDIHATAGTHSGALPAQRFGIVDGSLSVYRPFGVLRTLSRYPYEGDSWASIVWEHSFRTIPFELIGLEWPVRKFYNLILFGGHGRTWVSDDSEGAIVPGRQVPDGWHHEIGISLSGLFGIVRLDFAKRLDATGFTFGFAVARIF